MIQRIQTVYLFIAAISMVACAIFLSSHVAAAVAALASACMSLYDISLYKKRPLQATVSRILCFCGVAFIAFLAFLIHGDAQQEYVCSLCATVVATLCWLLASMAIIRDEKLVRSLDRIR